jgi:hypothetical protein
MLYLYRQEETMEKGKIRLLPKIALIIALLSVIVQLSIVLPRYIRRLQDRRLIAELNKEKPFFEIEYMEYKNGELLQYGE